MAADCEVCNETMAAPEVDEEPSAICNGCAQDMLMYASEFQIAAFLDIEVRSTGQADILVGEDTGPGIEYQSFGPFSLGDAFRRAKKYDETGDAAWLRSGADGGSDG